MLNHIGDYSQVSPNGDDNYLNSMLKERKNQISPMLLLELQRLSDPLSKSLRMPCISKSVDAFGWFVKIS